MTRPITAEDIEKYREFSFRTFGPADPEVTTEGVIDHIQQELAEVWEHPEDVEEWIDIVILAIDGAYRNGHSPQEIIDAYHAKCEKNFNREWPDWRVMDRRRAVEHIRS